MVALKVCNECLQISIYTNIELAKALLGIKVHPTDTILRNRKGLLEEVKSKRKNGESKGRKKNGALGLKLKRGKAKGVQKELKGGKKLQETG